MSTHDIRTKIEKKHRDKLEQFKRAVMDDANLVDRPDVPGALQPIRAGRFKSISNRFADLTILGDRHTLASYTSMAGLAGYRVSMSIAGHHRLLNCRAAITAEETHAWLYAAYGDEWAQHSYDLRSFLGDSQAGTTYYLLYLSEDLRPIPMPDAETLRGEHVEPCAFFG